MKKALIHLSMLCLLAALVMPLTGCKKEENMEVEETPAATEAPAAEPTSSMGTESTMGTSSMGTESTMGTSTMGTDSTGGAMGTGAMGTGSPSK